VTPEASTIDPVAPRAHEATLPRDRRGGLSFALVIGVFATLLALAIGFGFTIHRSYVAFERVAARHVPPDATLVVRWDVEKVTLFEPTRRFLLPLLDRSPPGHHAPPERRDRFAKQGGSVLGRDLREVLVAFGPAAGDWSVLLAGSFPSGDLVAAAERTLTAEGLDVRGLGAGRIALPDGKALGQGPDHVLVLASSAARLDAALATHPLVPEVPRIGAGALVLRHASAGLPSGGATWLTELGSPQEIRAEARWGNPLPVALELRWAGDAPSNVPDRVRRVLSQLLGEDLARIEHEHGRMVIQSAGNQSFRVEVLLDGPALERAANRAAENVERELALGPAHN